MTDGTREDLIVALSDRLAAATARGGVEWRVEGPDRYVWDPPQGTVAIRSRDADGDPPFELMVYNGEHVLVDELVSQLLEDDRQAPWNDSLARLHRAARRSALRADELLETLIGLLPTVPSDRAPADEPAEHATRSA